MKNKQINYHDRVACIPGVMGGKPVIKGTRIPVALILERLEEDTDTKLLLKTIRNSHRKTSKPAFGTQKSLYKVKRSTLLKTSKREHTLPIYEIFTGRKCCDSYLTYLSYI